MSEVTDWIAIVAMVPFMVVTIAAWGIVLFAKGDTKGRRKARPGAWILTGMTVLVAGAPLAGWVVPHAVGWSLVGVGLVLGVAAAWYLVSPSKGKQGALGTAAVRTRALEVGIGKLEARMVGTEQVAHELAMAYIYNRYGAEVTGKMSISGSDGDVSGDGYVSTVRLAGHDDRRTKRVETGEKALLGLVKKKVTVDDGLAVDTIFSAMVVDYRRAYEHFLRLLSQPDVGEPEVERA